MVADDLACEIARRYVRPGASVLDPFCGSGRLLLAAGRFRGRFWGVDVNPLACLLTLAKSVPADVSILEQSLFEIAVARKRAPRLLELGRWSRVEWYSPGNLRELAQIIYWLNKLSLPPNERIVAAAALSATARDSSYCRKKGWKLHRLSRTDRAAHNVSAWHAFERRLHYYISQARNASPPTKQINVVCGDLNTVLACGSPYRPDAPIDVVLTSPPYGDSRTTVQYGAASALCLDVVRHIHGFEQLFMDGSLIDATCLGGKSLAHRRSMRPDVRSYWAGARYGKDYARISAFLDDFEKSCDTIHSCMSANARVVFVLGRRSVGGFRLHLDTFAIDCMGQFGFHNVSAVRRRIKSKRMPGRINRYGRAFSDDLRSRGGTTTIQHEHIVVLDRGTP